MEVAPAIGLTVEECFTRLHSPAGLAIGAKNPAGIALAIVAEIHDVIEKYSVKIPNRASPAHV
jgi:xanthine/CO dehydrogenase XdhC/CoxF family maturation factor